jgi:rhodanese-related sulfurtransferase
MARAIGEMIILLALAILVGLSANGFSPVGIPLFGNWDQTKGSVNAGGPCKPQTDEIGDDQISDFYIDPEILFIDARSSDNYDAGHIPRAISLPVGEFENLQTEFMAKHPIDARIVVYCSGIDCHDSHDLAVKLKDAGYKNLSVYTHGWDGWTAGKRPVKEGTEP